MRKFFCSILVTFALLQAPALFANTSCTYTVNMFDAYSDGWNGTEVTVFQGGAPIATIGSNFGTTSGNPPGMAVDTTILLTDSLNTYFILSTGSLGSPFWSDEISFDVVDPYGITVASFPVGLPQVGDTLVSLFANCTAPSCYPPTALGYTPISNTSAEIYWTGGGASDHNVEYGFVGFARGTGASLNITNDTTLISGLTTNLAYEFYVRDSCAQGDVSIWQGPFAFGAIASECDDFEAYSMGPLEPQSILFGEFSQGPLGDAVVTNDQAASGNQSLKIQNTGPAGSSQVFAEVGPYTSGVWNLSFQLYVPSGFSGNGGGYALISDFDNQQIAMVVYLEAGTGRIADFNNTTLGTFNYTLNSWNSFEHIVDLDNDTAYIMVNNVAGTGVRFSGGFGSPRFESFLFSTEATPTGTVISYLDDFCVSPYTLPSCPSPGNLGVFDLESDSANIYWTRGAASHSEVAFGPAGFSLPGGGIQFYTSDDTISLGGLATNTAYEFYVRDSCASGDLSIWSGPYRFRTPCEAIMLPYTEAWETTSTTRDCWNLQGVWRVDTASAYGTGTYSLGMPFFSLLPGSDRQFAYSPEFLPTSGYYELSFDYAYASLNPMGMDTLDIMYSTNGGDTYQSLTTLYGGPGGDLVTSPPVFTPFTPTAGQWASTKFELPDGTNRIAFSAGGDLGNSLYLDNIEIALMEGCNPGTSASDTVCDSLSTIDLAAYLGTHSFGGNWYDDNASGALTDSTFDASAVTPMATYHFTYAVSSGGCSDSATVSLYVDDCDISLSESPRHTARLYPNPTSGKFYLERKPDAAELRIEIYSLGGQLIQSQKLVEEKSEIDLGNIANGVYNLRIMGADQVEVYRVIKK